MTFDYWWNKITESPKTVRDSEFYMLDVTGDEYFALIEHAVKQDHRLLKFVNSEKISKNKAR